MDLISATTHPAFKWVQSIYLGTFSAIRIVDCVDHCSEIALTIQGHEVARLRFDENALPEARVTEETTVVSISSPICPAPTFEIDCMDHQVARYVSATINRHLRRLLPGNTS